MLNPKYIYGRIKELQRAYRLRVLLCYVDTEDAVDPLAQVTKAALLNDCTLFCAWTPLVSPSETDLQAPPISYLAGCVAARSPVHAKPQSCKFKPGASSGGRMNPPICHVLVTIVCPGPIL